MIPQYLPQEGCRACRVCCRFNSDDSLWLPSLCAGELEAMVAQGVSPALFSPKGKVRVEALDSAGTMRCVFLNPADNTCTVYRMRPFECQLYPFLLHSQGQEVFLAADPQCPFVQAHASDAAFKTYVDELARFFATSKAHDMLAASPQLIQACPGVLTLVRIA